ncbi:MAG: type II toxin-antitoxin system prevent-host-death family antitoxin [Thermoleophilia bacterium]|jgi:prevent-host-death family protein|nr:type II toxin-antitoxin system prevent-host-death family antitoxin [Thermoleophilia bacterium]
MRTVTIAELKNNLSRYLREVRQGEDINILSRDVPVARLVPLERPASPLAVHAPDPAGARLQDVPLPPRLALGIDIVDLLLEERGHR